jgi:hypothetical protein
MTNEPSPLDADEVASRWLDEGVPPLDASGSLPAEMDEAGRRRLAKLQCLHGLLLHLYDRNAEARERRMQRVLQALEGAAEVLPHPTLDRDVSRPRRRYRAQRVVSWLISSAAVLLLGLIVWKLVSPNPAYAIVQRAFEATGRDGDRTYRVLDHWSGPVEGKREATLWVRGDCFVFQPRRPLIPGLLLGCDGRQGWAVAATGPVRVSDDPREIFRFMSRGLLPERHEEIHRAGHKMLPLLQQRTLLRNLGQSYRLELLPPAPLDDRDDLRYQHIRAHRRDETIDAADVVEIWVHPDSSVIVRLILQAKLEAGGERRVTLDLESEERMPHDWYEHSAHHEAGRTAKEWLSPELPAVAAPPSKENHTP